MFSTLTSSLLLDTLAFSQWVIIAVVIIWAIIILLLDRGLLTTYRKGASGWNKALQLSLRFFIAFLIALTVSHPVVLKLFSERIDKAYNEGRLKVDRENLAQRCDLTIEGSELNKLAKEIKEQESSLKNDSSDLFLSETCKETNKKSAFEEPPEIKQLQDQVAAFKQKADEYRQQAKKEEMGVQDDTGITGIPKCGTQCKKLLRLMADAKGRADAIESKISDYKAKHTLLLLKEREESKNLCESEYKSNQTQRNNQIEIAQNRLQALNDNYQAFQKSCATGYADIKEKKPDLLTQTELLYQIIVTKDGISWHSLAVFMSFMLLFLMIDILAIVLKMTRTGVYETKIDQEEKLYGLSSLAEQRYNMDMRLTQLLSEMGNGEQLSNGIASGRTKSKNILDRLESDIEEISATARKISLSSNENTREFANGNKTNNN